MKKVTVWARGLIGEATLSHWETSQKGHLSWMRKPGEKGREEHSRKRRQHVERSVHRNEPTKD